MLIVTTPVLITAAVLTLFFFGVAALIERGEKHRDENPYLKPRRPPAKPKSDDL